MFSCRLSESEFEALESLLGLDIGRSGSKSESFRAVIVELNGRLERDFLKHIQYKVPKYERA